MMDKVHFVCIFKKEPEGILFSVSNTINNFCVFSAPSIFF